MRFKGRVPLRCHSNQNPSLPSSPPHRAKKNKPSEEEEEAERGVRGNGIMCDVLKERDSCNNRGFTDDDRFTKL